MNKNTDIAFLIIFLGFLGSSFGENPRVEYVVLLHGLARSAGSMAVMEKSLTEAGYGVINDGYPSTKKAIEALDKDVIPLAVEKCRKKGAVKIHFVTHSMGGILIRYYLEHQALPELGRVVMLSPPNQGSETVDKLKKIFLFKWINGPAGQELGTDSQSVPLKLGPVNFDAGVITGDRTINIFLSMMIPGKDDGKVSITHARVEGMKDFLVVHTSHPFIMKNKEVIRQTMYFLKNGKFDRSPNT